MTETGTLTEFQMPTPWDGKIGDIVEIDHPKCKGQVYRVVKLNPSTVGCEDAFGKPIKADRWLLKATDKPFEVKDPGQAINVGAFVRFTRVGGVVKSTEQVYIVIKTSGQTANVVLPGGDGGRYVRVRDTRTLAVVPAADVLK